MTGTPLAVPWLVQEIIRRKRRGLGVLGTALLLGACSGDAQSGPTSGEAPEDATPETSKKVVTLRTSSTAREQAVTEEATAATRAEQALAFELLQKLPAHENQAFSPRGLSSTFAKLTDAAAGATLEQIARVFGFDVSSESFHRAQNALSSELASRDLAASNDARGVLDAVVVAEASDLWLSQDAMPQDSYVDTLARFYGGGVYEVDFRARPNEAREAINRQISSQTHGLIGELLPEKAVTSDTVLVLTSALYFKAPWATPFDAPSPSEFHLLGGAVQDVPMLRRAASLPYYEGQGFASVSPSKFI